MARGTMTVKQLRLELDSLPPDALVFVDSKDGAERIDSVLYDENTGDEAVWLYTERL